MTGSSTKLTLIATLTAITASGAATIALAGVSESVPTTLKMRNGPPAFHGKVKTDVPDCESDRRVKLFKEKRGTRKLLGRTNSNFEGKWYIPVEPLKPGAYIAKVKQHIVSVDGVLVRCEPDFAPGIVVD
jgi:hypothetical protein